MTTHKKHTSIDDASYISPLILQWYAKQGRENLPWRSQISPYRVWVSEIMLQQTQVATVLRYFPKFLQSFPTIQALSNASSEEVLHHWSGLGYYRRGHNLHKAAKIICESYGGQFPSDFASIQSLPGIGRSTAGAILSIAFKKPYPILDANVQRILCRYFDIEGTLSESATQKKLWEKAQWLTPTEAPNTYAQAIMDFGATICTKKPQCDSCPLSQNCLAKKRNTIELRPLRKKVQKRSEKLYLIVLHANGKYLLTKKAEKQVWKGLWGFLTTNEPSSPPNELTKIVNFLSHTLNTPIHSTMLEQYAQLPPRSHILTHIHFEVHTQYVKLNQSLPLPPHQDYLWYDASAPSKIGISSLTNKIMHYCDTKDVATYQRQPVLL